jgi:cytochrome c biogenesis protein CcdA/thiol-disulfide isomerase/thioredoxin
MTLFVLTYLAGVLTIATPCIFPILPFVLARADEPFRRSGLPMLVGMALAFAAAASLAAAAGGWAVAASQYGRSAALVLMMLFGLGLLLPSLAARLTGPLVAIGIGLSGWVGSRMGGGRRTALLSLFLGVATGLLWAPCAGPVLGLILTGAAVSGPSFQTSLLLLVYASGAATSLAAGSLLGGSLLARLKRLAGWGESLRRILGAAVVAGVASIWLGLDTGLLTRWSSATASALEQRLVSAIAGETVAQKNDTGQARPSASAPTLAAPLASLLDVPQSQWLNAPGLSEENLRGKVVLVNFWTYSCINCLRTLPHVRAWAEAYKDRGLVVIGVHTPEFAFEKDIANVAKAAAAQGVGHPVAIDSSFRIWRAFHNSAWPALYLFDADGRLRDSSFGEGGYDRLEQMIRRLLAAAGGSPVIGGMAGFAAVGPQAPADLRNLLSGETYLGYRQSENFASPGGIVADMPAVYQSASRMGLNQWSLGGNWTIGGEFASLNKPSGRIVYRFHARDLHLVMAPATPGQAVRFRLRIDGAAPGVHHGVDVDAGGQGLVQEARLYQLVRQAGAVTDHTFEIEFLDAGVRAYAFTFG